jgi:hypothetical protein
MTADAHAGSSKSGFGGADVDVLAYQQYINGVRVCKESAETHDDEVRMMQPGDYRDSNKSLALSTTVAMI